MNTRPGCFEIPSYAIALHFARWWSEIAYKRWLRRHA